MMLINELNLEDESFTFELKITSMTQHANGTQVNATGKAGRYGKVWLTYEFTPNPKQNTAVHLQVLDAQYQMKASPMKAREEECTLETGYAERFTLLMMLRTVRQIFALKNGISQTKLQR